MRYRSGRALGAWAAAAAVAVGLLLHPVGAQTAAPFPGAVNLVPAGPVGRSNCIPFGNNTSFGFTGFVYRGVPPFTLRPGDRFAFDLGATNDVDVRRDIYLSPANKDPRPGDTDIRAVAWTKVASEDQVPQSPRGNTVIGDYELVFRSEAAFAFPGGGLVVGFGSTPPGGYADTGCDQVVVHTTDRDPSGHFVGRFYNRPDRPLDRLDIGYWDTRFLPGMVIFGDSVPPVTTATVTPDPDASGWHHGPVTVHLSADDGPGGSGVAEVRWTLDGGSETVVPGATADVAVAGPGSHLLAYHAVDRAGNVEHVRTLTVRIAHTVRLDVLPGSAENPLQPKRKGLVPLAVLSAEDVDATGLGSLRFGATGTEDSVVRCAPGDVDGDGHPDLVCQADMAAAGFDASSATARLRGMDAAGVLAVGSDAVRVVGR